MQRKYEFYKDRDYTNIVPVTAETFKEALLKAAEIFGVDTSRVHWSPNFTNENRIAHIDSTTRDAGWRPEPDLDF